VLLRCSSATTPRDAAIELHALRAERARRKKQTAVLIYDGLLVRAPAVQKSRAPARFVLLIAKQQRGPFVRRGGIPVFSLHSAKNSSSNTTEKTMIACFLLV
jgi:hypothetical protein